MLRTIKYLLICYCLTAACRLSAQNNTLDYYLQTGLNSSPLLHDYQNQLQFYRLDSAKLRATYKPQVSANTTNSYAPIVNGWGYDEVITNGTNITAMVGVNKTFVSGRNIAAQLQSIQLLSQGISNNSLIAEQDLKRAITTQYITTYGDGQQLRFLNETYKLLKEEDEVLKKLTQNNVYRQTDYLTFLVTLQQQELVIRQSRIQLRNDYATLNYLCGIVDTTVPELQEPGIQIKVMPEPDHSIFFRQYRIDSLALRNKKALIDFNYKPRLSAFGDAGYISSLVLTPYKNFGYNFGITLSLPIYDGRQRKLEYSKLVLAEQTRAAYQDFFSRQYNQQLRQLQQQLAGTQDMITQINEQIRYSEGLIKAHTRLLGTGDVKVADLVIALNNYLTARNLLTQNTVSRWQIINQINYWNR